MLARIVATVTAALARDEATRRGKRGRARHAGEDLRDDGHVRDDVLLASDLGQVRICDRTGRAIRVLAGAARGGADAIGEERVGAGRSGAARPSTGTPVAGVGARLYEGGAGDVPDECFFLFLPLALKIRPSIFNPLLAEIAPPSTPSKMATEMIAVRLNCV